MARVAKVITAAVVALTIGTVAVRPLRGQDQPAHLRDGGTGVAMSMFGTYVQR